MGGSAVYGASISFQFSSHPRVSAATCGPPPGVPLLGLLKSPLCLIGANCQRNISVFSLLSGKNIVHLQC